MKREAKLLVGRSVDALILSIELFNRPWDRGRTEAVLIHIDHSFELLLKAAIVNRGGIIREKDQANTIGFDHCVKIGLSDGKVNSFLSRMQRFCAPSTDSETPRSIVSSRC